MSIHQSSEHLVEPDPVYTGSPDPVVPYKPGSSVAASIPLLSSNPNATAKIYLDFDGYTYTSSSYWTTNSQKNPVSMPIVTPAFDINDGSGFATFSAEELNRIQEIWQRVAEDYSPFNVDVTTIAPTSFSANTAKRAVIGGNGSWYGSAGGVAYVGGWQLNGDIPAWIFSDNLGGGSRKPTAEAISHEVGHLLGLSHQSRYDANGNLLESYHTGSGSGSTGWAPIMGVGYYQNLTTWNNGPTDAGVNSLQDNLAVITSNNGFGYRSDDYGNTISTATPLIGSGSTSVSGSGIISQMSDVDVFSFTTGAGLITLNVSPAPFGPNLDIVAELRNSSNTVIASSDPASDLSATISSNLSTGTYYLAVKSNAQYGRLGQYTISGTTVASIPVSKYNFTYYLNGSNGSQDYYTGYVYAKTGNYNTGSFYDSNTGTNETGNNGKYYINSVTTTGTTSDLGKIYTDKYYDVDSSGSSFTPVKFTQNTAAGTNYLGSEYDTISNGSTSDYFGYDYYEADLPTPVSKYNFTYYLNGSNGSQDYYTGYVYAKTGNYNTGSFYDSNTGTNETGNNGKYYINSVTTTGTTSDLGKIYTDKYYDVDSSGSSFTPVKFTQNTAAGTNYLGSEYDTISNGSTTDYFGYDYYEADIVVSSGDPGNTLGTAEIQNSAVFSRNQQVSANDRDDFYRFAVGQSGIFTANLTGLSGDADVRLIQDKNSNSAIDQGEILAWQWERGTGSESIRRFLNPGTYFLQVNSYNNQTANYSVSTGFSATSSDNRQFLINTNFVAGSEGLSQGMKTAVQEAADFWKNVISYSTFNGNHTLNINVGGSNQQWDSNRLVLASAGYTDGTYDANGRWMPTSGQSNINTNASAVSDLSSNIDFFKRVMIHEFGHILGIGTLWQNYGRNLISPSAGTYNVNTYASWAYGELKGTFTQTAIPLTTGVGAGSDLSHWKEEVFDNEIMTHQAESWPSSMPLSQMTIASLRDIGWNVNYGAAETYSLPRTSIVMGSSSSSSQVKYIL